MGAMLGLGMLGGAGGGISGSGLPSLLGAFTSAGLQSMKAGGEAEAIRQRAGISERQAGAYAMRAEDAMRIAEARAGSLRRRAGSTREAAELGVQEARAAQIQGEASANELRKNLRQTLSSQRAIYGASGIDVGSGTPVAVGEATKADVDFDIETVLRNADIESAARRISVANLRADAAELDTEAVDELRTGIANRLSLLADADMARYTAAGYRRSAKQVEKFGNIGAGLSLLEYAQKRSYIG
jgi:hypothetical protein